MIRLEYYRNLRGLSQLELAEKVGMTQQRISAYELGKREPDLETIKLFANFFEITTDELLGIPNQSGNSDNDFRIGLSRKEEGSLSEEEKQQIRDFAKYVISKRNGER